MLRSAVGAIGSRTFTSYEDDAKLIAKVSPFTGSAIGTKSRINVGWSGNGKRPPAPPLLVRNLVRSRRKLPALAHRDVDKSSTALKHNRNVRSAAVRAFGKRFDATRRERETRTRRVSSGDSGRYAAIADVYPRHRSRVVVEPNIRCVGRESHTFRSRRAINSYRTDRKKHLRHTVCPQLGVVCLDAL